MVFQKKKKKERKGWQGHPIMGKLFFTTIPQVYSSWAA